MQTETNLNVKERSLISRIMSIIVTLIGSFVFVYFTITAFIRRVFESGPDAFPAVWQDWAIVISLLPTSFIIFIGFLAILKDLGFTLPRQ